ncbi:hypothetical protein PINS_up014111 [Pythium insidiosum]|nr:hypothetical protein PINS_up014111 [Pythium insidiosum]
MALSHCVCPAKGSIYLNDITAVVQFDDTHFQVESRTRNFFLCGESKASTVCWVRSLDDYRRKRVEYEKEVALLAAAIPSLGSDRRGESTDASSLPNKKSSKSKRPPTVDDTNTAARDVSQTSSASSSNPAHDSSRESFEADKSMTSMAAQGRSKGERKAHRDRSPSPTEGGRRESHRTRSSTTTASSAASGATARKSRSGKSFKDDDLEDGDDCSLRTSDLDRDQRESRSRRGRRSQERQDRENDDRDDCRSNDSGGSNSSSSSSSRRADRSRDRSTSRQRRATTSGGVSSSSTTASTTSSSRHKTRASYTSSSHQGYVMEAWVDDFD